VLQRLASLLETVGERARADELKRELLELRGAAAAGDGAKGR
jgi:ribosomal protein L29